MGASDVWQTLSQAKKPIVLYGMGDGADKILAETGRLHIPVSGVFASDDFVRGQFFHGFPVEPLSRIGERFPDCIVLLAFGTHREEILRRIETLAVRHELYAPDVPVAGGGLFDSAFAARHSGELREAYSLFADERSRLVFQNVVEYKLSGRIGPLLRSDTRRLDDLQTLFRFTGREAYFDGGAYNGDTVREFLTLTGDRFSAVYAAEPDPKSFTKLERFVRESGLSPVFLFPAALWKEEALLPFSARAARGSRAGESAPRMAEARSIDRLLEGRPLTYLKLDVEGAEKEALLGAAETIRAFRPKLSVAAYHKSEDLFTLPLLIHRLEPSYRIFLRRHRCLPAWDVNIYAAAPGGF